MKSGLPVKKIVKLNFLLTINTILFFVVLRFLNPNDIEDMSHIYKGLTLSAYLLLMLSFGNLGLFLIMDRLIQKGIFKGGKDKKTKMCFLTSSHFYAIMVTWSVIFIHRLMFTVESPVSGFRLLFLSLFGVMVNSYILAFQYFVVVQEEKYRVDIENSNLRAANTEAVNQLLKHQIQPHFLFNSLNILKSLYKRNVAEGEKYLICLSNFLRASLSSNNSKVILVKEEMELCQNYINMQKLRFGESLQCSIKILQDTLNNAYIPSFSIQPLIENAIKHNELTDEQPLVIKVEQEHDWIKVSNNLKLKVISAESTGLGLTNLSERYKLLCGEDIIVKESENTFSVKIKLLDHKGKR